MNESEKELLTNILKDLENIRNTVDAKISQLHMLLGTSHNNSIKQQIQQRKSEMLSQMEELRRKAEAQVMKPNITKILEERGISKRK